MKAKIAVIGMGQGGMVAAVKLARYGAEVTVYERNAQGQVSYDWKDDITANVFDECGIERPDRDVYCQKANWMFLCPSEKGSIKVPQLKPFVEISVDRRKLSAYFADLFVEAGGKIYYETPITRLVVEDERVVGVQTPTGFARYDLVIDATGMNSILRGQVPAKFCVQSKAAATDMMFGYRAFFKVNEGAETVDPSVRCTGTFKHLDMEGLAWCNRNENNQCDVLICRVGKPLSQQEIDEHLAALRATHAILSQDKISELQVPLSVRAGIATPVADGYCAIGDSAFMTIPVMGSGIETGMKGGAMLADWCYYRDVRDFSAANLWGFYYKYMHKFGGVFSAMDAVRRYALRLPSQDIDWMLCKPFITYEQLTNVMYDKEDYRRCKVKAGVWLRMPWLLWSRPGINHRVMKMVRRAIGAMRVTAKIPEKYSQKAIEKWCRRYNGIIERIEKEHGKEEIRRLTALVKQARRTDPDSEETKALCLALQRLQDDDRQE